MQQRQAKQGKKLARVLSLQLEQDRATNDIEARGARRATIEKREQERVLAEQERIEMDERRKAFMAAAKEGGRGVSDETAKVIYAVSANHDERERTTQEERANSTLEEVNLQHTAEMATHMAAIRSEKARQKAMLQARLKTRRPEKGHL
jgi:hypothetical protein